MCTIMGQSLVNRAAMKRSAYGRGLVPYVSYRDLHMRVLGLQAEAKAGRWAKREMRGSAEFHAPDVYALHSDF